MKKLLSLWILQVNFFSGTLGGFYYLINLNSPSDQNLLLKLARKIFKVYLTLFS